MQHYILHTPSPSWGWCDWVKPQVRVLRCHLVERANLAVGTNLDRCGRHPHSVEQGAFA